MIFEIPIIPEHAKIMQRMYWVKKDERSLSEILDKAAGHYERYQKTKDPGQKFAYVWEMLTLAEHVYLVFLESKSAKETLANNTYIVLDNVDVMAYSTRDLSDLSYVADKLERAEITRAGFRECNNRLERIMSGKARMA